METWVNRNGRLYCAKHAEDFVKGLSCSRCVPISMEALSQPLVRPVRFATVLDHEKKFCEVADELLAKARELLADDRFSDAARFYDLFLKSRGRAMTLSVTRENSEQVEEMLRSVRSLRSQH